MKNLLAFQLTAAAITIAFAGPPIYADDTPPPAQSHEEHHPDSQSGKEMTGGGMMDSMSMEEMSGMMHQCMEMHKGGTMCDHDMMEKCQMKMGKGECQKMMKQAKAHGKKMPKETK